MNFHHVSVLRKETIDNLITDPDGIYVDCTLGGGGHSRALAERLSPKATLIGLDQDRDAIAAATERLKDTAGVSWYSGISAICQTCSMNWG